MPSYVVIGASKGIGYSFLNHLAQDPDNTIIGTARNVAPTAEQVHKDNLSNVTILQADMLDRKSLIAAASQTSEITGGKLDYLIVNGGYYDMNVSNRFLDEFENDPEVLDYELDKGWKTNVVGVIYAINAFLPLVKKGTVKKVMALSTGLADDGITRQYGVWESPTYAINKAALNTAIAKYAARYATEGFFFLSISPGMVDTGHGMPDGSELPVKFGKYAPHFAGPITPAVSVEMCLNVLDKGSVEKGDSGAFLSHMGTKQWL